MFRSVLIPLASAGIIAASGAVSAAATEPVDNGIQIVDSGVTADGGWVEFTGEGEITVDGSAPAGGFTTLGIEDVGGGTWSYGSGRKLNGQKTCRSEYFHPRVKHGSSVSMGGTKNSDWVGAGKASYAYVAKYTTATCKAYWRK